MAGDNSNNGCELSRQIGDLEEQAIRIVERVEAFQAALRRRQWARVDSRFTSVLHDFTQLEAFFSVCTSEQRREALHLVALEEQLATKPFKQLCQKMLATDPAPDVRAMAITALASVAEEGEYVTLGRKFVEVFDDVSQPLMARESAYFGLCMLARRFGGQHIAKKLSDGIVFKELVDGFRFPDDVEWWLVKSFRKP